MALASNKVKKRCAYVNEEQTNLLVGKYLPSICNTYNEICFKLSVNSLSLFTLKICNLYLKTSNGSTKQIIAALLTE